LILIMTLDPYATLGVTRSVSDHDLRAAYRRLVQRHHPDHNGGSVEAARRFEAIQLAYSQIREERQRAGAGAGGTTGGARRADPGHGGSGPGGARPSGARPAAGEPSSIDERLAAIEFELREAQRRREQQLREARLARERAAEEARAAAQEAASQTPASGTGEDGQEAARRARAEELGYFRTDDSFGKILSDARDELTGRFAHAREHPVVRRVSDLIDGLDEMLAQVDPRRPRGARDGRDAR
jgi:curved DNA-binding protein CbpA